MVTLPQLVLAALGTLLLTHLLMPVIRKLGLAWGLVDHPSWRRRQKEAVPCSGGLAIYASMLVAGLALAYWVGLPFRSTSLVALGLSGLGIIVLGVVDDRFGLHAEKKLLGQVLVVSLPMASGLTLQQLTLPGLGIVDLGMAAGPITLFWYLGFINSVNLIDGLDGLAAGIVMIVLGSLVVAVQGSDPIGAIWTLALLGAVLGFLRDNLSDRRIFLGDAGSMLLGLWIAGLSLGLAQSTSVVPGLTVAAMFVPVLDTSTTILRRWRRRVSVFRPDAEHLHHRLLQLGTTPRRAMACLWFVSLAAASLGAMTLGRSSAGILALGAAAAAAVELAYTLQQDRHPDVRRVLGYLLGLHPTLHVPDRVSQLAEVIEMESYRELRRGSNAVHPPSAAPSLGAVREDLGTPRPAAKAAVSGAGTLPAATGEDPRVAAAADPLESTVTRGDADDDVVLALNEDAPR